MCYTSFTFHVWLLNSENLAELRLLIVCNVNLFESWGVQVGSTSGSNLQTPCEDHKGSDSLFL
jgi:hypothetical protein